ncbi:MAG: hypothetical protein MR935_02660 [Agathobaculum sp.]|uniref:hypothetical protein n=1 Tax=Agathobaculum sp. TaxID=2048138 RepID=UPI0025BBB8D9|nr:hypothetical protein [Agathobaculum sp.]MCI7125092.1 hypothetical protein [Agathobaculum sp.]MDY3711595.1 hypothetical protein [Agathobaculum sp.]
MTLYEMSREYRANTALLELRLRQLQAAQRRARQPEVKFRLKRRIGCLRMLINESRKTAFALEHYHERSGQSDENAAAV